MSKATPWTDARGIPTSPLVPQDSAVTTPMLTARPAEPHTRGTSYRTRTAERLAELEAFVTRHHRLPRYTRTAPDEERSLAGWLAGHRRRERPQPRVLEIIATHPGGRVSAEERMDQLESFVRTHGRLPRLNSPDRDEVRIAVWAWRQDRAEAPDHRAVQLIRRHGGYRRMPATLAEPTPVATLRAPQRPARPILTSRRPPY